MSSGAAAAAAGGAAAGPAGGTGMEVEVKLRLPDVAAHAALAEALEDNYFFDGAGQELSSRRVVLRVRLYDESKKAVITVKGKQVLKDGIGRAPEEEEEIEPAVALRCLEDPNLLLQLDSPLLRGLASSLGVGSLVGLGGFLNVRQEYEWRGQLLELDETRYEWGTLYELECETSKPERLRGDLEAFLGQRNIPFAYSANTKFANFRNRTLL